MEPDGRKSKKVTTLAVFGQICSVKNALQATEISVFYFEMKLKFDEEIKITRRVQENWEISCFQSIIKH